MAKPNTSNSSPRRDRRVELMPTLSDQEFDAIEASQMQPGLSHLDAKLLNDKHIADGPKVL
ncbi:hypothetical protein [Rhizobium sp. R339]|uniref:hypothetical protein n=1 Tax=Rhizobium sp. R339 TaxID=1764273 RepID=UPI001130D747|nr:hypothetical protein [Rhizobium sp. R339]